MKTKILILLVSLLSITSCKLDLDTYDNVNGEKLWSTPEGNEQILAGGYSRLRKILSQERPLYLYGDLPATALMTHGNWVAKQATEGDYKGAYMIDWYADWSLYFEVITTANTVLKHINDVPIDRFGQDGQKRRDRIRGEAYFLYSLTYFHMVRIYGELPLVKEAIENAGQSLDNGSTIGRKQSTEVEILEYLLETSEAAVALLDFETPGSTRWAIQADKAAALTLRAHILLWLSRDANKHPNSIKFMNEAEQLLDIVINSSNRSLVSYDSKESVNNLFRGKSSEGIFELNFSAASRETYYINPSSDAWKTQHGTTYFDISKETLTNLEFMLPLPGKANDLYSQQDKRRTMFYQNLGNGVDNLQAPPFLLKYAVDLEPDPTNTRRYFVNSNIIIFRLSECILLRAETLNRLGRNGNAKMLLNIIRNRAGIGNYDGNDADLAKGIFNERVRELAGEGHSAFDRIRTGYWEGCEYMSQERIDKRGYYWPVNIDKLIGANRELRQNPYWASR